MRRTDYESYFLVESLVEGVLGVLLLDKSLLVIMVVPCWYALQADDSSRGGHFGTRELPADCWIDGVTDERLRKNAHPLHKPWSNRMWLIDYAANVGVINCCRFCRP